MLAFYIILGVLLGLILILSILAIGIHHVSFGKRWDPDGIVKYYSLEDFPGLKEAPIKVKIKKGYLRGNLYYYSNDQYKGIFIFSHGMWGSHKAYMQEIECLAKNGYKVLGFDNYGTELSDGKNIKGLGNSLFSLNEAISYVKQTYPKEKIYVMGHSWGGFAAVNIAKYQKNLEAIVAMSPFISVTRILRHQLPKFLYPTIPFILLIDALHCGKYSFANAKKTLKNSKTKTLIIHSRDDQMVPYQMATGYLEKVILNQNIKYYIVDGKKHNPDYTVDALLYTEEAFKMIKNIPNEKERQAYRINLDYHKMGELDEKIFDVIFDFLQSS